MKNASCVKFSAEVYW